MRLATTRDLEKIAVRTVPGSKHCSMLTITEMELRRLRAAYPEELSGKDAAGEGVEILLAHARETPGVWRYTSERPGRGRFTSGFDDSQWRSGRGGFGTHRTPNTLVGTVWDTREIWLRLSFTVDKPVQGELYLRIHHDEDSTVYLNGVVAATVTGWNSGHELVPVRDEAAKAVQPGRVTVAVNCRQTAGGQYIDVGLVALTENRWSREKAWRWYRDQDWPCGFNYVPANAISYTEMWMGYSFDPQTIDKELALAERIGFNCLRVVLPFVVWEREGEGGGAVRVFRKAITRGDAPGPAHNHHGARSPCRRDWWRLSVRALLRRSRVPRFPSRTWRWREARARTPGHRRRPDAPRRAPPRHGASR